MARISILLFTLLLIGLAAFGGTLLYQMEGAVEVSIPGRDSWELKIGDAILAAIFAAGVLAALWWLLAGVVTLPWTLGKSHRAAQVRKANKALAEGLLAAEAGDAKAAMKLARRAERYAEDDRLKLLLQARAAEASDDWSGAEHAWSELMDLPGGELAGLRGAASAALERGDTSAAETRARRAVALKSGADWPFNSLFDLQVSRGRWSQALDTLNRGQRHEIGRASCRERV
jgi:HemY protein